MVEEERKCLAHQRLAIRPPGRIICRAECPSSFPTRVRAAGSGLSYNVGRFATAVGVLAAGILFTMFHGSYPTVGALAALIYALGMLVIWWAPDTSKQTLQE